MTNHETAAIEERVARELAAHNWCGGTAGDLDWGKRTPQFRNEYLALARQTIAIVRDAAAVSVPPPAPQADAEAVARVRALHQPAECVNVRCKLKQWCIGCDPDGIEGCDENPWPCPTVRALDGEQPPVGPCVAGEQQAPLCRCGHGKADHDAKYSDPQCRLCPEDGERSWRHAYTPAREQQNETPEAEAPTCPDREPLIGVQCSKESGHKGPHSDRPGRIWYPVPAAEALGPRPEPDEPASTCTCGDAGDAFVPLGHYRDCPDAAGAQPE